MFKQKRSPNLASLLCFWVWQEREGCLEKQNIILCQESRSQTGFSRGESDTNLAVKQQPNPTTKQNIPE